VLTRSIGTIFSILVLLLYLGFFYLEKTGYPFPQQINPAYLGYIEVSMWFTCLFFIMGSLMLFDLSTLDLTKHIQSERQKYSDELYRDEITGAFRQEAFIEAADKMVATSNAEDSDKEKYDFSIIYIYIENLKNINSSLGYECGDYVFKELARNIAGQLDKNSILARISAEYFSIFTRTRSENPGEIISFIFKIKNLLTKTILFKEKIPIKISYKLSAVSSCKKETDIKAMLDVAKTKVLSEDGSIYVRL
jgi:diguanylate cyclase (GGDEF)-like protein